MALTATKQKLKVPRVAYGLLRGKERLSVWQKMRGMWKHRKPEPVTELRHIRKGWERATK